MPIIYSTEPATILTCAQCFQECNPEDETMTTLDGKDQCEGCRSRCGAFCEEYITDETIEQFGPVVRFRDYAKAGKLVHAHAECAGLTLIGYMGIRLPEWATREEIAAVVEQKADADCSRSETAQRIIAAAALEALEDLLDAIPKQTNDADWWPDELSVAVKNARAVIAKTEVAV
jgi:hypothetical protein